VSSKGVLEGLRIVEASAFVAAPLGGMTLAQLGADVIRIDPIGGGLDFHRWPEDAHGNSLFWNGLNKEKRSVTLDLRSPRGQELARALVTASGPDGGILLTNLPPRGWLEHGALKELRRDVIQLTLEGNRHGGSAVDYTVNPGLGLPLITGPETITEAVNHVLPAWDLVAGQTLAVGLLAAERHRRITGEGQHVRLALNDLALSVMGHLGFLAEAELGRERERVGNYLYGAFGRDFVTRDDVRVMVVGLTPRQWRALTDVTGLGPELGAVAARLGLDFVREGDRYRGRKEIAATMEPWFRERTVADLEKVFQDTGVCWSRYRSVMELVREDAECSEENPLFSRVSQPGVGTLLTPGTPLLFSGCPHVSARRAPELGEHTDEVLREVLGIESAELDALRRHGIIASTVRS